VGVREREIERERELESLFHTKWFSCKFFGVEEAVSFCLSLFCVVITKYLRAGYLIKKRRLFSSQFW
jgi:hypothetical protein